MKSTVFLFLTYENIFLRQIFEFLQKYDKNENETYYHFVVM